MSVTIRAGTMTPEQYLAIENCAETKSEFVAGQTRAMAGASPEHVAVSFNLGVLIGTQEARQLHRETAGSFPEGFVQAANDSLGRLNKK